MGMTAQHQRNPLGHPWHDVGFVREQDDGIVIGHLAKRRRQVVDTDPAAGIAAARRPERELVTKSRQRPTALLTIRRNEPCR